MYTYNFKNQDRVVICDQIICTCVFFFNKWYENIILMIIKYTHLIIPNVLGAFVPPPFFCYYNIWTSLYIHLLFQISVREKGLILSKAITESKEWTFLKFFIYTLPNCFIHISIKSIYTDYVSANITLPLAGDESTSYLVFIYIILKQQQ